MSNPSDNLDFNKIEKRFKSYYQNSVEFKLSGNQFMNELFWYSFHLKKKCQIFKTTKQSNHIHKLIVFIYG